MRKKTTTRIVGVLAALALSGALAIGGYLLYCQHAAHTEPSPTSSNLSESRIDDDSGAAAVDWDYWRAVNPDIIGWITIPGTEVDSPILQAHASAPDYWLHHDVYGRRNPHGAIYLDAECENDGLFSQNAVILGHHFPHNVQAAPFGILARYKDTAFASEHDSVLIQTPERNEIYHVRFANVVKGTEPIKRTSFEGEEDHRIWYDSCLERAAMVLDAESRPEQTIELVTCSYNFWAENERTVVVAAPE